MEDFYFDRILDKISKNGVKSLTKYELEYLDKYSKGEHGAIRNEIEERENEYKAAFEYDPREDEFYKDLSIKLKWTDEEIEDGRYRIIWDGFDENDMLIFINDFSLDEKYATSSWEKLPDDIKDKFKKHVEQYK